MATLLHNVYIWISEDQKTETNKSKFEAELGRMLENDKIVFGRWGVPAATPDRDVVNKDFDYSIHLEFQSVAHHNEFQKSVEHDRFVDECEHMFEEIRVFDTSC